MNSAPLSEQMPRVNGSGGTISFCRPSSIMRIAEAPNLYVDGEKVASVKNNSSGAVPIDLNQSYRFGLEPSALFMRVSDQTAFEGVADMKEDRYFIISGKLNVDQGIAILAGGIIGAAAIDKQQDTGQANWDVSEVSQSTFLEACS
ncbi:MAG: hypothetical protein HQ482_02385 [Sphingomonadales bacterium]|nr:hypothetical protein [Sphingomonadales bacterium]